MKALKLLTRLWPIAALVLLSGCLTSCIAPDYQRLVADDKDAHIEVYSIYGRVIIDTRAAGSQNPMPKTQ